MDRYSEIAKIAYELYISRQGAPGDSQADWFVAERIFAEREILENPESPVQQGVEVSAPSATVKRARARAKSNGAAQPEARSTKSKAAKSATEKAPRKKGSTGK